VTIYTRRFKVEGFVEVDVEADSQEHAQRRYEAGAERDVRHPAPSDLNYVYGPHWVEIDDGNGWYVKETP
jgi:hypothetical protein